MNETKIAKLYELLELLEHNDNSDKEQIAALKWAIFTLEQQ